MQFKNYVCSACRKYGVPLTDGKCDVCFWLNEKPKTFRPSLLPVIMVDLRSNDDNPFRQDTRRTAGRDREWI